MMANRNFRLPPAIQARIDFIERAREQLIAKRNNLIILRDIEKLFYDEQNFLILLNRNVTTAPAEYREVFESLRIEVDTIKRDLEHINHWRKQYLKIRAERILDIKAIEGQWEARPNFRVLGAHTYADETQFMVTENVPELEYRLRQFYIYWEQLLTQFCGIRRINDKTPVVVDYPSLPGVKFAQLGQGQPPFILGSPIEPKLPSRDYIFVPGRPYWLEHMRYMHMFVEESIILGPHEFHSDEFIPYIPLHPETQPETNSEIDSETNHETDLSNHGTLLAITYPVKLAITYPRENSSL